VRIGAPFPQTAKGWRIAARCPVQEHFAVAALRVAANECSEGSGEIALAQQGIGHRQRADAVVGEAAGGMEQGKIVRWPGTSLEPGADDVACDGAEHFAIVSPPALNCRTAADGPSYLDYESRG
jgi:hypothetical protein